MPSSLSAVSDEAMFWPAPLADYERPPVVETVMAVHFTRLSRLSSVELLDFWRAALRDDYPVASERPAYQVPVELFEAPGDVMQIQMELSPSPGRVRYWFQSESNEDLIQLQNDWLAFNWRKVDPSGKYRHFPYGVERFRRAYDDLQSYLAGAALGPFAPRQVEVTYINHIAARDGGWTDHADLGLITDLVSAPREGVLPRPEMLSASARYPVHDDNGPVGRLHVEAQPQFLDDGPAYVLRLTYRGKTEGQGLDGVLVALERGHQWVVGTFDEITTGSMHDLWGRKNRDE